MLRIHQTVQAGNYPNASTLARELEVSTKSIQRDLEFMRDRMNLPLARRTEGVVRKNKKKKGG
jgi:proteasome accessory factor B